MAFGASHLLAQRYPLSRDKGFWVLFACLFNTGVANSILFALLPALAVEIGLPAIAVGATYIAAAALFTVMSQVWGRLSDRVGRRPLIVLGLCGAGVSMWAMAETIGLGRAGVVGAGLMSIMLVGARAIFGLLNSAVGPGAVAWVADRTSARDRTKSVALMTSAFGLGAACGPMIGGQLAPVLGYAGPLVVTGGMAFLGAVLVGLFVEDHPRGASRPSGTLLSHFGGAFDRRLRAILAVNFMMFIVQAGVLQTLGFVVIDRLDVTGEDAVLLTGFVLTGGAIAALVAQMVIIPGLNLRPRLIMVVGGGVGALGAGGLAVAPTLPAMVWACVVFSLGAGLVRPGAGAAGSLAVGTGQQGYASGLVAASAGAGFFVSPLVGTGLYMLTNGGVSFAVMAVLALLAGGIAWYSDAIAVASARAGE